MKAIILVAGYATRLYPLTKDNPKPLLPVAGKPILAHILEKIKKISIVDEVILVSNAKFATQFQTWTHNYQYSKPISVLNDGTTSNENKLGAIADLSLAIKEYNIKDDILVLAGDNLFDFELTDLVSFYHQVNSDCITANQLDDIEYLKRTGVVEVNQHNKVISFVEKPAQPPSNLAVPAIYIYQVHTLSLIDQYLIEGNNPDAPGNFIPWLIQHKTVYAYRFENKFYDVGTVESYEQVKQIYNCKLKSLSHDLENRGRLC